MIIESVNYPEDVKKLGIGALNTLSGEIRKYLIDTVSNTGGHLASNLGVVEITLALLKVFDVPRDKIVFDVGHQCYVYKMLTGRKEELKSIRSFGGISGFPKSDESIFDAFNTGHAGTAVSVCYGISEAMKIDGSDNYAIAVVGDASISNGVSLEALNNAGRKKTNLIVILNDNDMSIGKNTGGIHNYLSKIRTAPEYRNFKEKVKGTIERVPILGKITETFISDVKKGVKHTVLPNTIFDDLGFNYIGPVDGHDTETLIKVFEGVKKLDKPVLIHTVTKKGKGYSFAERNPNIYHGVGKFDKALPVCDTISEKSYSYLAGKTVCDIAGKNENIVAVCCAMAESVGLSKYKEKFPERFFDEGIAEAHAVTFAGGLSKMGKIPVIFIYSTFLQRAYDNIIHDISLNGGHAVFMVDRAGITGKDGETHQGIFDIAFLSHIPNSVIFTPYTKCELEKAVYSAVYDETGCVFIRYPKGTAPEGNEVTNLKEGVLMRSGEKVTVVTYSQMTGVLEKTKFDGDHIHLNCVSDIDFGIIEKSVSKTKRLRIIEDSMENGGIGQKILSELFERGISGVDAEIIALNGFVTHGSVEELLKSLSMDKESLEKRLEF